MTLEELKVVISATLQPLKEAMNKAKAEVKNATGEMDKQVEKTKKSFFSGFNKGKISPTVDTSAIGTMENEVDILNKKISMHEETLSKLKQQKTELEQLQARYNEVSRILDSNNSKVRYNSKLIQEQIDLETRIKDLKNGKLSDEKLTQAILKEESALNSLYAKLQRVNAKLEQTKNSANNASKGVNNLGNKSNNAKNKLSSLNGALNKLGIGNKKTKSGMDNLTSAMKRYAKMIVINRLLIASLVKGIRSLLSSMATTLKTNSQFSSSLAQIQTNLRVAFTPIYQAILPAINTLMSALSKLTGYIASFTSAIFGKTYAESKAATQSLIDAKAAMGAYGDTTEKTKKAVDRLAGIDEINKLSNNSDSDNDNDKSNVPVLADVDTSAFDGKMERLAKKMKEIFKTIFQPFKNAWKKDGNWVTDKFNLAVENTKKSLSGFYESLKNPAVQKFIENIAGIGIALGGLALSIYNNFVIPVVNWFISLLPSAAEGLNPLLEKIKEFIKSLADSPEKVQKLCSAVLGIATAIKVLGVTTNPVIIAIAGLVAAFVAFYASNEEFRDKMQGVWEGLWNSIKPVLDNIGKILKWLLDEILAPLAEWTISDLLPAFFNLVSGALDVLNPLLEVFMDLGKWLWDSFLQPIASWTGGVIVSVLNSLADVLKTIGNWMSDNKQVVEDITVAILAFFGAWEITKLLAFIEQSGGVLSVLGKIKDAIVACTVAKISDKLETVKLTALYAKDFVVSLAKGTAEIIKQIAQFAILTAAKVLDAAKTVILSTVTKAMEIAQAALNLVMNMNPISLVILAIAGLVAIFITAYKKCDWFRDGVNKAFEKIKNAVISVKETFSNVFGVLWDIAKKPLNFLIKGINALTKGLNKINFDVPDWVPGIGGKKLGFNIPEIPMLAQGGYVSANNPTLAMIGDNARYGEIVAPENKLNQLLDKAINRSGINEDILYKAFLRALKDMPNQDINLNVDGVRLGNAVAKGVNKITKVNGGICPIIT